MPENDKAVDPYGIIDNYTPALDFDVPEVDKTLVDNLNQSFEKCMNSKLPYERKWEFWRQYLQGNQLIYRDEDTNEIVRVADHNSKRLFSQNNQMRPAARSLLGKLCRTIPQFNIVPPTATQEQIHGAKVGEAYMRLWRRTENFEKKYIKANKGVAGETGVGVFNLFWDVQGGRQIMHCGVCGFSDQDIDADEGEPCPACEMQNSEQKTMQMQELDMQVQQGMMAPEEAMMMGQQIEAQQGEQGQLELINEGAPKLRVIDPRDIWVEPGVDEPEDLTYLFVRHTVSVHEARRMFPHMAPFLKAESGLYVDRSSRISYSNSDGTWGSEYLDDHLHLYEYYEAPTGKHPRGRIIYYANDMILRELESPYWKFDRLPFFWQFWDRNSSEFWPESWMNNGWHRQKELNENETIQREHGELLNRAKVLNPIGNQVTQDEFTSITGQMVGYNAAMGPPSYLIPPPLPNFIYDRRESLKQDIREQASVTDQEMGNSPGDPNGRAMAIVEAEADQQIGPTLVQNHSEVRELFRCLLILAQENVSSEYKFTIMGDEGAFEVYSFQDFNLAPGWDLELEIEDGLSKNQAVRVQQTMDIANVAMSMDPTGEAMDIKKFANMARIKVPGLGPNSAATEHAAAMMLIRKIEDGQEAGPSDWDDPVVFRDVLLNWLRTKGRQYQERYPMTVMKINELSQYYSQVFMSMQEQMAPPPVPGQAGPGSGPGGPDQTAQGGSANNPGNIASDAAGIVNQADRTGEAAAKVSRNREG